MNTLNDKLLTAYDNNDVIKMKKYSNYGAVPHVNNSTLFFESIFDNKPNVSHILMSHGTSQKNMHQIMHYAYINNSSDCLKVLLI